MTQAPRAVPNRSKKRSLLVVIPIVSILDSRVLGVLVFKLLGNGISAGNAGEIPLMSPHFEFDVTADKESISELNLGSVFNEDCSQSVQLCVNTCKK